MDVPSKVHSNTESLFTWIEGLGGHTFSQKCEEAIAEIEQAMAECQRGDAQWKRWLRTKGLIEGFIRHDRDLALDFTRRHELAAAA